MTIIMGDNDFQGYPRPTALGSNIANNRGLIILQRNAKGLCSMGHGDELKSYITNCKLKPDVICIQGTWFPTPKANTVTTVNKFSKECLDLDSKIHFSADIDLFNENVTNAIQLIAERNIPKTKLFYGGMKI